MSFPRRAGRWRFAILAAACFLAVGTTVYRWVDEKGVTQYSDQPPPGGRATRIEIAPPAGEPSEPVDWARSEEEFRERHRARQAELEAQIGERRRQAELETIDAGNRTPVPGDTVADVDLQRKVLAALVASDQELDPACSDHPVTRTEALERDMDAQVFAERWVLDRCGTEVSYRVEFGSVTATRGRAKPWPPGSESKHEGAPPRPAREPSASYRKQPAPFTPTRRRTFLTLGEGTQFTFAIEGPG